MVCAGAGEDVVGIGELDDCGVGVAPPPGVLQAPISTNANARPDTRCGTGVLNMRRPSYAGSETVPTSVQGALGGSGSA